MKTLQQAIKDGNNSVNQRIKDKFVGIHVQTNVNSLVEPLINNFDVLNNPVQFEEWENMFIYPEFSNGPIYIDEHTEDEREELIQEFESVVSSLSEIVSYLVDVDASYLVDAEKSEEVLKELADEISNVKESEILTIKSDFDFTDLDAVESLFNEVDDLLSEFKDLETEPQEIYEYWAVSSWLFEKLRALGHPVVDAGSCYIWGRCTTGQVISLDYAITKVCADMGILEGQESSWENHDSVKA